MANLIISQNSYDSIVKHRKVFTSQKPSNLNKNTKKILLANETLYDNYTKSHNLQYLNEALYLNKKTLRRYKAQIFRFTYEYSKTVYELKQWNAPIVVYIDRKIPKNIVQDFKKFYTQIDSIENLKISFTSNIKKANYFIKTTTEKIKSYSKDYEFDSEEEKENSILTGAKYNLLTDDNNKFYSGILTVNIDKEIKLLKQLKQLFFMSLGQFYTSQYYPKESILSKTYENKKSISQFDLDLLKIHYSIIYDQRINGTTFEKLIKLSRKNK